MNWSDADKVSSAIALRPGLVAVPQRYHLPGSAEPLEGRRVTVLLAVPAPRRVKLEEHCLDASGFALSGDALAFQCVAEQAGHHLLHRVVVHSIKNGEQTRAVDRCRSPAFAGGAITCRAEAVNADGRLQLRDFKVHWTGFVCSGDVSATWERLEKNGAQVTNGDKL